MSRKFLHIVFENAKLFKKNSRTKDRIYTVIKDKKGKFKGSNDFRKNYDNRNFIEPITPNQISNMLHVMFGERPIPSFRSVPYKKNNNIYNMALDGYLKIDSPKQNKSAKDSTLCYLEETINIEKGHFRSRTNMKTIEWYKILRFLGNELSDIFLNEMSIILGYNPKERPFMELLGVYNQYPTEMENIVSYLTQCKKKMLVDFLKDESYDLNYLTKTKKYNYETVNKGVDKVSVLYGDMYIPIDDNQIHKIQTNVANILDGGFARIVGIVHETDIYDTDSYTPIREISTETH